MTNTKLKLIALFTMLLDHIWRFGFDVPYGFHIVSRISAPIFMYCCVLGFVHTSNRKKYFIRLYLLNVAMGIEAFAFGVEYNFVRTIMAALVIIFIIDQFRNKHRNAVRNLVLFVAWQISTFILIGIVGELVFQLNENVLYFLLALGGSVFALGGGMAFLALGVLLYLFRTSTRRLFIGYACFVAVETVAYCTNALMLGLHFLLSTNQQAADVFLYAIKLLFGLDTALLQGLNEPDWAMIFALPIILAYNGEKGRGMKYLFYVFYPAHIACLFLVSNGVLNP